MFVTTLDGAHKVFRLCSFLFFIFPFYSSNLIILFALLQFLWIVYSKCWIPNLQCDGIWKCDLGKVIKFRLDYEGRPPDVVVTLIGRGGDKRSPSPPCKDITKRWLCAKEEEDLHRRINWNLDLRLCSLQNCEKSRLVM